MKHLTHNLAPDSRRVGLSMIEVIVCTLLVGLLLIASLESLGQLVRSRTNTSHKARATLLAHQLMVQIVDKAYVEPGGAPALGRDAGENTGNRLLFDDVDDYDLWTASPPQAPNGTDLINVAGWQRDVNVEWVDLNDPTVVSVTDQGIKRITVWVRKEGTVLAKVIGLRSEQDPGA